MSLSPVPQFARTSQFRIRAIPITIASTVLITVAVMYTRARATDRHLMPRLVASVASKRYFEARLTGFSWKPMHVVQRDSRTAEARRDYRIDDAAKRAIQKAENDRTSFARHAAGIAYLLTDRPENAIASLTDAGSEAQSAELWNDLAAAKYVLSVKTSSVEPLIDGLVAVDSALQIDNALPEARFNRALIIEMIGLRELAADAWRTYLEVDQSSEWAIEARAHEREQSKSPLQFRDELERRYDAVARNSAEAEELAFRFPQEIRTWGETEILARWAEAEKKSDSSAGKHLAVARTFGRLAARRGDLLLQDAVRAVDRATAEQRQSLASAHLDFRLAQRELRQLKPATAEPIFARAARDFESGHSPVALLAHYFRANTVYEQGRVDEALASLVQLHAATPAQYRSCRAQMEWEIALCYWANAQWGKTIDHYTAAMEMFDSLHEGAHAGAMRHMLAGVYDTIGNSVGAWKLRTSALRQLGQVNSNRLQAALGSLGTAAILRRDWPAAQSVLRLELDAARAAKNDVFTTDALLRRALVLERIGDLPAARAAHAEARIHARLIEDSGMRAQYEGRLLWVDGALAESPEARVALLTRAIEFHQERGRRMLLPSIYYERARAHRSAGSPESAVADLESAVIELESHRETLPGGERRWGVFHASEDIFDAAIDLALGRGDVEGAFHYADRARATTLLDALKTPAGSRIPAIPAGYTIIEYNVSPERLRIFVADQNGVRQAATRVHRKALGVDVRRLREALEKTDNNGVSQSLRRLHHVLIEPIESWIPPNDTLVIVPDATVGSIPFAALADSSKRFLIEKHAILIAPSAAFFARTIGTRRIPGSHLLMVVNADVQGWERLPQAMREAAAISRLYPDETVLEGPRATPEAFDREAKRANLIHFSGHALASEVTVEDTFLLLSNARRDEERYDVKRIAAMHLDCSPVVVLAACSTARGPVSPLEGTLSAARGFLAAGAGNVVATLWPIADDDASTFFELLHNRLSRGDDAANALRSAQIQSIRNSVPPSMWAAVQSIGK